MKANIRDWEKGLRPPVYRVFQTSLPIFFIEFLFREICRYDFWWLENKAIIIFRFDKSHSMLIIDIRDD